MSTKAEQNLKKLANSSIPMTFVKKNNGEWDHQKWVDFCEGIKAKGFEPINYDEVGLLLEAKKAEFFATPCCKKAKAPAKPKPAAKKPAVKKAAAPKSKSVTRTTKTKKK